MSSGDVPNPTGSRAHANLPANSAFRFVHVNPPVDKENQPVARPQPSAGWLKNPAWIGEVLIILCLFLLMLFVPDGGVNPPQFYYSHEEIDAAHRSALTGAFSGHGNPNDGVPFGTAVSPVLCL